MMKHLAPFLFALAAPVLAQGWVDVTPPIPGPLESSDSGAMCFDPVHASTWLFINGTTVYRWDGVTWTSTFVGSTLGFTPRWATWDSVNNRVLLAGGGNPTFFYASWDGVSFSALPALPIGGGTFVQNSTRFAFDASNDELLTVVPANGVAELYALEAGGWVSRSPVFQPQLNDQQASFFFDAVVGRPVLIADGFGLPRYTEWTGSNWVQRYPSPIFDGLGSVVSAPARGLALSQVFWLGELHPRAFAIADGAVSELFLNSWPGMRQKPLLAYDETRDVFILHGGYGLNDTWELDLGDAASYTTFGVGCAGAYGTPTISPAGDLPSVNTTFTLQVSGLPWTGPVFMWLGFSNQFYGSVPLPANLAILGAPLCDVLISPDALYPMPNVLGTSLWQFPIPNLPGAVFYNQAVAFDQGANALGLIFSNAGEAVIGQ